jgi:serine/threonine protein kinase
MALVMELCDTDLTHYLQRALTPLRKVDMCMQVRMHVNSNPVTDRRCLQVMRGLYYVLKMGFVHFDIKPDNILVRADDRVVLTDFGCAMRVGEDGCVDVNFRGGNGLYKAPEVHHTTKLYEGLRTRNPAARGN